MKTFSIYYGGEKNSTYAPFRWDVCLPASTPIKLSEIIILFERSYPNEVIKKVEIQ
jgi:hypothetical protein